MHLTESITASKYPEYAEYQQLVNKFVPGLSVFSGAIPETKVEQIMKKED